MILEGFLTIDGERHAVTFEIPALNPGENEPLVKLAKAEILGHLNELTFAQDPTFHDPVGLRFAGSKDGAYGSVSGNHRRVTDGKQVQNSTIQFKRDERDRNSERLGGEITIHCLDGRLGQDDAAMQIAALFRAREVIMPKLVVGEIHAARAWLRGEEV